jgi:hypothetical protein
MWWFWKKNPHSVMTLGLLIFHLIFIILILHWVFFFFGHQDAKIHPAQKKKKNHWYELVGNYQSQECEISAFFFFPLFKVFFKIGNYACCSCIYFVGMSTIFLGKCEAWAQCKHLYHILQNIMYYGQYEKFIYYLTWSCDKVQTSFGMC